MKLNISAKKVLLWLLAINVLIIAVHLVTQWFAVGLEPGSYYHNLSLRVNMDIEESIPTWWAQTLLFGAAGLLFLIGFINRRLPGGKYYKHWLALGVIFTYVSIDEGSGLHEMTVPPVKRLLDIEGGILYFAWVVPFALLLLLAVAIFFRFWWRLPSATKRLFALSFAVFVSGAMGVEMIAAHYLSSGGERGFFYAVLVAIEEGLEKTGTALFIYALLDYIKNLPAKHIPRINVVD